MEYNFIVDEKMHMGIPRLKDEEYEELVKSIRSEGIRDAIIVWNGQVIDGRHRYEIAKMYGLDYKYVERNFDSFARAHEYALRNQLARRNLDEVSAFELGEELEATLKVIAAEKQKVEGALGAEFGALGGRPSTKTPFTINGERGFENEEPEVRESNNPTEFEVQRSTATAEVKAANPTFVVGNIQKAVEKIDVQKAAAKAAGMSHGKYSQFKIIKANNPEALEKIRARESTAGAEYKKLQNAAKKEEEKNRIEIRALTIDTTDLGVVVEKGLFTRTNFTGSSLTFCSVDTQTVDLIKTKIASTLLPSGCLIIVVKHTDIAKAIETPTYSLKFRGDTVLNYDGVIKHALTFSKEPHTVPEYLEGTHDEVYKKLIEAHTMAGDVVMFPYSKGLETVSLLATDLKRKSVVFEGEDLKELAVRYQGIREKMYGPMPANILKSPNYEAAKALGAVNDLYPQDNLVMSEAEAKVVKSEQTPTEA